MWLSGQKRVKRRRRRRVYKLVVICRHLYSDVSLNTLKIQSLQYVVKQYTAYLASHLECDYRLQAHVKPNNVRNSLCCFLSVVRT